MIKARLVFMEGKTSIMQYNDRLTEICTTNKRYSYVYFIKNITDFTAKRHNLKVYILIIILKLRVRDS